MISWQSWVVTLDNLGRFNTVTTSWIPTLFKSSAFFICQQWFNEINGEEPTCITQLVHRFRRNNCSDVHDKVYGLLGLASDASKIQVDYHCTKEELFFDMYGLLDSSHTVHTLHDLLETLDVDLREFRNTFEYLSRDGKPSRVIKDQRAFQKIQKQSLSLPWKSLNKRRILKWTRVSGDDLEIGYREPYFKALCACCSCSSQISRHKPIAHEFKDLENLMGRGIELSSPKDTQVWFQQIHERFAYVATCVYNM
jgi:hypothetical protein